MSFTNPKAVLEALVRAFYEERSIDTILSCVTDSIEWIGTESNEVATGKAQLKQMLAQDFALLPPAIRIDLAPPSVQPIGADGALLTLVGKKLGTPEATARFAFRGTIYCVKTAQGWLIANLHISAPNTEVAKESLENALAEERAKQKALLENVPGGVAIYRIKKDGRIEAEYVSDGLAKSCGYADGKDALAAIGYDARPYIFPEDFPKVAAAVKASVTQGASTSIQYRVYGKDRKPVLLTLDSVLMRNVMLDEDDAAVFYAVQIRVSDEHQKEIREEEIRQRLMNYVPGGIGIYDLYRGTATLQYLNEAYLTMMGLTETDRAQYYNNDISGVIYPEDRHALTEMIAQIYAGERLVNAVFRAQNGQGKWKWIKLVMQVVPEKDEHYTGYANLYDFDQVIQNQQEMEEAHKKEETLLSSIPGGIAIYHIKKDGRVGTEYVSDALARMCGYTAEEFLAYLKDDALVNLVPEDVPPVRAALEKALASDKTASVTYRIYKKDKTPILIRLDANQIQSESPAEDEAAVFYAVHTLVSEESKRIIEEQKSLSLLLNSVPAGIGIYVVKDGILNQEYMNDAFFEILHDTRENRLCFAGSKAMDAIHPEDRAHVRQSIGALVGGASTVLVDYRLLNGLGGYTWFHVSAAVAERNGSDIRFFIAFSDCNESKMQELVLLQNQRAVELAQTQGELAIWTYNIDRGIILQQIHSDEKSSMGYRMRVEHVPACFIEGDDVYPDDIEKFLQAYRELAAGREKVDITYRLRDQRTGEFSWVRMFYQRTENNDEHERIAVGFSMNVDKEQKALERYRVEQALREKINENVLMYMEYNLTKDRFENDGKITEDYTRSEWEAPAAGSYLAGLSKTVEDAYVAEVAGKMSAESLLKAFAAGETRVSVEFRAKGGAGEPSSWCNAVASLVKRPDTGDVMAFVSVENIENEKDRRLAVESSLSDGVEVVAMIQLADRATTILLAGGKRLPAGSERHMAYDDEFVRRSTMAVVPEDRAFSFRAALFSTVLQELEKQELYRFAVTTGRPGQPNKRQLFRYRYLDDRKTTVVMSVVDVTSVYLEDLQKKKQLEAALDEAQQASRAKAEFYSRMSHDMRTPMNGILGMAELSRDETDSKALRENIGKIKDSGEYLLSLINDTLDLQRIESGKMKLEPTIVCTADVVRNVVEMIGVTAKAKGVHLKFNKGNADLNWYIRADALRLKQIFINLLSNAVKFTPADGTVEFELKLLSRTGPRSHDVIYVRDTGVGMSKEFLKNGIFKPFSQESNAVSATYAGSGLGLSIAKSLVELMGGRIEVESELGVGTTFAVYLDFVRVEAAEAEAALQNEKTQLQSASAELEGKRILLAEDHPLNAEIANRLLQKVGCVVTWAKNGQEALDLFAKAPPHTFDAVLMDIRMPVLDGLAATRAIRALEHPEAKTVPIIAMTANAYAEDVAHCMAAGMNAHLGKPIAPKDLYDTLATYLNKAGAPGA